MRVLAVGTMYPPHHLGGYELVWRSAMRHLRAGGHLAHVLTTGFRTAMDELTSPTRSASCGGTGMITRGRGSAGRIALERHNAAVLDRHLHELRPEVVSWWAMGGMSRALIERVRRAHLPAVALVADDWLLHGPKVDRWTRVFRLWGMAPAYARTGRGPPLPPPRRSSIRRRWRGRAAGAHRASRIPPSRGSGGSRASPRA